VGQYLFELVTAQTRAVFDDDLLAAELPQYLPARPALKMATVLISRSPGSARAIAAAALRSAQMARP
jgi:hypothetical protein